ncbi:MAG: ATP-binding protein [Kiritimatiellae bacterium]|nr:ATP-binding protein [Kiritimatiellia bacterium]MDD4734676.1 ATP-binding protein [Kiritimatiellia bacterium]
MINRLNEFNFIPIPADEKALETARQFVLEQAERLNLPAPIIFKIELALEEILVNVVHYAYPPGTTGVVDVGCLTDEAGISLCIADSGRPFNPLEKEKPDLDIELEERQIGGLGIFLTREMVDAIEYRREQDRNIITFTIRKP